MGRTKLKLIQFFLLAFGFTWLFWIPDALGKRGILWDATWTNLGFIGAFGPIVSALFLVYREDGKKGVKKFFNRGLTFTFGAKWWLIVLVLFPLLILIAYAAGIAVDSAVPASEAEGLYWFLPFLFFVVLFTGGPFTEEFGWRGYALPRLQSMYVPFWSTLLLGIIWAAWHLPQFLVPPEKTGMFYTTPVWSFMLTVIAANFVYTWVYNRTNENILAVIVLHTQMNLFLWIFPVLKTSTGYIWILVLFALAALLILLFDGRNFFVKPEVLE